MITRPNTNKQRMKRHKRVRAKISGTPVCPRLNVFRSEANIYAQIIDDVNGVTLASASSLDKAIEGYGGNVTAASAVGKLIAERALAKGIENVVFDRGGYLYHGRGRCRKGTDHRPCGKLLDKLCDFQVAWAEILTPLGNTVCLINTNHRNFHRLHRAQKFRCQKAFRGDINNLVPALHGKAECLPVLRRT